MCMFEVGGWRTEDVDIVGEVDGGSLPAEAGVVDGEHLPALVVLLHRQPRQQRHRVVVRISWLQVLCASCTAGPA